MKLEKFLNKKTAIIGGGITAAIFIAYALYKYEMKMGNASAQAASDQSASDASLAASFNPGYVGAQSANVSSGTPGIDPGVSAIIAQYGGNGAAAPPVSSGNPTSGTVAIHGGGDPGVASGIHYGSGQVPRPTGGPITPTPVSIPRPTMGGIVPINSTPPTGNYGDTANRFMNQYRNGYRNSQQ